MRSRRLAGPITEPAAAAARDSYSRDRLDDPRPAFGQIDYYQTEAKRAQARLAFANGLFWLLSLLACAATGLKLMAAYHLLGTPELAEFVLNWGGLLAIGLPVAAVGFVSWAAASDLEARANTFAEMHAFLQTKSNQIKGAQARELHRLVREIETRLLNENLHWFSRRSFTAVA